MITDIYEFTIAGAFLPALINGDNSGLSDREIVQLEFWVNEVVIKAKADGAITWFWSVQTECSHYAKCEVCNLYSDAYDIALVASFKNTEE